MKILSKIAALTDGEAVPLWSRVPPLRWDDHAAALERIVARWQRYRATGIDTAVSEHDDMLSASAEGRASYFAIGETALRTISEAMTLACRDRFPAVLDLPCGGGRVTRHLKAFFPDAEIFVADIDQAKQQAVAAQFGTTLFPFPHDFAAAPGRKFDLIFSGSLLTHLPANAFERALDFFIAALDTGGLAILTLHGRSNATEVTRSPDYEAFRRGQLAFVRNVKETRAKIRVNFDPDRAMTDFARTGFGYFATPTYSQMYGQSYGGAFSLPSWVLERVQKRLDCLVLGYKERSYGDMQDVLIVQKL